MYTRVCIVRYILSIPICIIIDTIVQWNFLYQLSVLLLVEMEGIAHHQVCVPAPMNGPVVDVKLVS